MQRCVKSRHSVGVYLNRAYTVCEEHVRLCYAIVLYYLPCCFHKLSRIGYVSVTLSQVSAEVSGQLGSFIRARATVAQAGSEEASSTYSVGCQPVGVSAHIIKNILII